MNLLLLIFLYVVWGTTYTAIVYALPAFDPFTLAAWRFVVAGTFFIPFGQLSDWRWGQAWPHIIGGIGLATGNALVVWSQTTMPSGLAALFVGSVPLWLILMDWLFFSKTRPKLLAVLGCFVGLFGLYYLSIETGRDLSLRLSALALIVASFSWSIGTLVIRYGGSQLKRKSALSIQLLSGGLFQFFIALCLGEKLLPRFEVLQWSHFFGWFYLVVFGSVAAMIVYNELLGKLDSAVIGTYALANPIVALLLGHWLFSEVLKASTVLAGVCVLFGVALILLSGAKPRALKLSP